MEQLFTDIEPWAAQDCDPRRKRNRQMRPATVQDLFLEAASGLQQQRGIRAEQG